MASTAATAVSIGVEKGPCRSWRCAGERTILRRAVGRPQLALSRDEIARIVQGHDWSPLDRTVDGNVARLRHKLEGAAEERRMIKSVRGVGYVFATDVSAR